MADNDQKGPEKKVDEDWKRRAREETSPESGRSGARPAAQEAPGTGGPEPERDAAEAAKEMFDALPPFVRLLADLGVQASVQLGLVENPVTGKKEPDLEAAKRILDILGALEERTRGNLEPDEAAYLEDLLYSLRMGYVKQRG